MRTVEHVQFEMRRQDLADFDPAHAVAVAVEQRRERAQPELPRNRGDDAAADAALGRDADAVDPFAGVVVHARRGHDRQRARDRIRRDDLLLADRIDTAIGERRRHDREITRRHKYGALLEIDVEHLGDVALDDGIVMQQKGDGAVAVAGRPLGLEDGLVDAELAAGEAAQRVAHALESAGPIDAVDQARAGDRPGVDHRIEWPVVRGQADGVERLAAWLYSDLGFDPLRADKVQRQREDEGLRDGLDGEFDRAVAGLVDVAVDGREADAEMRRIGLAQFRDVIAVSYTHLRAHE